VNVEISAIINLLSQPPSHQRWPVAVETWFSGCEHHELSELVGALQQQEPPLPTDPEETNWGRLFEHMLQRQRTDLAAEQSMIAPSLKELSELYEFLGPASRVRHLLLALLAQRSDSLSIEELLSLLIESPPIEVSGVAIALSPFLQSDTDWDLLFPRLFQALSHPVAASAILDLSNFITRQGKVPQHPAVGLVDQLEQLLKGVVNQLASIEDGSITKTAVNLTPEDIASQVNEGIALASALCDAIALIGDIDKTAALFQAMDLAHRRIQAEAAAALVRLGVEAGSQRLGGLAEEPSVRLRVLAYAEELGVLSEIASQHQSLEARSEGTLALHLAEPHVMGLPPTKLEIYDHSQRHWPGFEEAQDCFLFKYEYSLGGEPFCNIGIGAPEVLSSGTDLTRFSVDDLYAYFAGKIVSHTDIFEMSADDLDSQAQVKATRYQQLLREAGYEEVSPITFGFFFEHQALAVTARKGDQFGVGVIDDTGILWFAHTSMERAMTADDAYYIYKGGKLFESFETLAE
jgi:hypothetical protein